MSFATARLVSALPEILDKPRRYWVHSTWAAATVANVFLSWWALFQYREVAWTMFRFLLFVAPAVGMLFIAAALAPDEPSQISSWREHYYRIHRQLVGATLFFWVAVAVANAVLLAPSGPVAIVTIASVVVILAPALVTKNARVQGGVAIAYLVLVLAAIGFTMGIEGGRLQ